ncbi:hypothetical protein FRZ40_20690 [Paraburkholderia azotifigens]|uniref:Uncharacterized protein n=1 Tax=Paraburkholderia azotifigens TaxID=2057004 RepID=A0A5C6VGB2_9BURK|nr:hypothetical protein FRZ40_20690 [Paraburkholderia azotifigens]
MVVCALRAADEGGLLWGPFLFLWFCLRGAGFAVLVFCFWLVSALSFGFFCCCWHPRFRIGLLALPLCGAALTFFAAAKKVSKESGLTPPILVVACGPPTGPALQTATRYFMCVANASNTRITHSTHP